MSESLLLSTSEIWAFLLAIEAGEITLNPFLDPQQVYGGRVSYRASNGWEMTVFNDCNVWDYLEELITPDGYFIDYDDLEVLDPALEAYRPSTELSWQRYRIPGYLKFCCFCCGSQELGKATRRDPLLCKSCLLRRSPKVPAKVHPNAPFPYLLTCDLPPEQLTTLHPWLLGQTRAVVPSEGLGEWHCVYYHDYERWYENWNPSLM